MPDHHAPLLANKYYKASSVFTAENLLREARRQKSIPEGSIPSICILDPDGDLVRFLVSSGQATIHPNYACYHTQLYMIERDGTKYGIVPHAVGASFAVLVAEELFACGCRLLISVTSAGQIVPMGQPPYFVLIIWALRDEGRHDTLYVITLAAGCWKPKLSHLDLRNITEATILQAFHA